MSPAKRRLVIVFAPNADSAFMIFQGICHDPFQKYVEDSNCCSEPISYAAVEEDGTGGLVIEVFDDLDTVCADVVLLHGCLQSCMQNPVEGFLEVYEDMVEVLLVLDVFFT